MHGLWCTEPTTGGPYTNNLWVNGQECDVPISFFGLDNSYRGWFDIGWINTSGNLPQGNGFLSPITALGGFMYVSANKISDSVTYCVQVGQGVATNAGQLWLNAQKLESPAGWLTATANYPNSTSYLNVLNYADSGSVSNGINISSGVFYFNGGTVIVSNGTALNFGGGAATFVGTTFNTSAGASTNDWPVVVATNGLILSDCTLLAPAGAAAIYSGATPVNVALRPSSYFNTAPSGNVTLTGTNQSASIVGSHFGLDTGLTNASGQTIYTAITNLIAIEASNLVSAINGIAQSLTLTGTNTLTGSWNIPGAALSSLANGGNADIPIGTNTYFTIASGPTAAFYIAGIAAGADGREITFENDTGYSMSVSNNSGFESSSAANRILVGNASGVTCTNNPGIARFRYNAASSRWVLVYNSN